MRLTMASGLSPQAPRKKLTAPACPDLLGPFSIQKWKSRRNEFSAEESDSLPLAPNSFVRRKTVRVWRPQRVTVSWGRFSFRGRQRWQFAD
jgi:hypothetical protein